MNSATRWKQMWKKSGRTLFDPAPADHILQETGEARRLSPHIRLGMMSQDHTHETHPRPSGMRRALFMVLTIISPILIAVVLETAFRLTGAGEDLSLYRSQSRDGRTWLSMNPGAGRRYFRETDFRPSASADCFAAEKPPGTFRIFCLGGSTTVGYPYWYNGSFPSFLRDRLRRVFPERQIEVINAGMTATNSFAVVDIAREVLHYQADLIIVYDGHNEFYGALGVASHESPVSSRFLVRAYLRLLDFRSFALMRDAVDRLTALFRGSAHSQDRGTMMEVLSSGNYVPMGSPVYRRALAIFRENLIELTDLCASHNVPLILSTQFSNLRNLQPFAPGGTGRLTPEERLRFNTLYNLGLTHFMDGRIDSALSAFRGALLLDSLRADTHYQIARCLDSLGKRPSARVEYTRARDEDEIRFRASSDFNEAILAMDDGVHAAAIDMERVFREHSPDSLIGSTLVVDHLHPSSGGSFLMGKALVRMLRLRRLIAGEDEWRRNDTVSDARLWRERDISTIDEAIARRKTEVLTSGWPFLPRRLHPPPASDTLALIAGLASEGFLSWEGAHREAGAYYKRHGETDSLAREERIIAHERAPCGGAAPDDTGGTAGPPP